MINSANCIKTSTAFLPDRKDEITERKENQPSPEEVDSSVGGQKSTGRIRVRGWTRLTSAMASGGAFSASEPPLIAGKRRTLVWWVRTVVDQRWLALISAVAGTSSIAQ